MSRALSAVALIAAYNEADIIETVVRDLIANGLSVYFIDDGSTDDTAPLVEPFVGRGVVAIERFDNPSDDARQFSWERLLRRKAQLATELDADWFIHQDADEFRESPWTGVPLVEGIRQVDALGYNAIDFANFDFWPTHDGFAAGTDVRDAFPYYSAAAPYDRVQVRCWRKTSPIDLASSGGHDVRFDNRRVFPIRFISRHYPIRGQAHGERKVFVERRPRFSPKERERKWHVQYDGLQEGASFVRDPGDLTRYDGDAMRVSLTLRHRGVEELESSLAESQSAAREDIARHTGQIAELNGVVERLNHDLASQREDNRQLRAALESRTLEIGETRGQLAQVNAELERMRLAFEQESRDKAALMVDVARRDDHVAQLQNRTEELDAAIADTRAKVAMRERELAAQTVELVSTRGGLQDVRGRLDELYQSWSWRITAPARTLLRRMRGF